MMQREVGNKNFPIWLLGDSNPLRWQVSLHTPLDARHPVRHNIWTPVLEVIQDKVFRECRSRIETSQLYIRNAVADPRIKPHPRDIEWGAAVNDEVELFVTLIDECQPKLLFCFGAFAFEFARRAYREEPKRSTPYWGARRLGEEFRQRIHNFDPRATNVLPLLHRSISGGKFIQSHDYFSNQGGTNYFEFAGRQIAEKLIMHRAILPIWIE